MSNQSERYRLEAIDELRDRIRKNPNFTKYHETDVRRAEHTNWWLESFIKSRQDDLDIASAVFFECLKWRQAFGVHAIGLIELKTALENNFVYFHGNDTESNRLLWINFERYDGNERANERLFVYWLERHVVDSENQPIALFMNLSNATAQNMDLNFIKFALQCLRYYYPGCCRRIYAHDLPIRLSANWRVVKQYIDVVDSEVGGQTVQTSPRTIATYIPLRYVPKGMGGNDEFRFTLSELARCTGSPLVRARQFGRNLSNANESNNFLDGKADESPLNSLIEEVKTKKQPSTPREGSSSSEDGKERKRAVKFESDYSQNTGRENGASMLSANVDWQNKKFMAVAPKRSITITYNEDNPELAAVTMIIQSMSAWYVYFTVGMNSKKHVSVEPSKGILGAMEKVNIKIMAVQPIKSPCKYKIEICAVRFRDQPVIDEKVPINIYDEPPEDRVRFHYDCFARATANSCNTITSTVEPSTSTAKYKGSTDCFRIEEDLQEYDHDYISIPSSLSRRRTTNGSIKSELIHLKEYVPKVVPLSRHRGSSFNGYYGHRSTSEPRPIMKLANPIIVEKRKDSFKEVLDSSNFWGYVILLDLCLAYIVYFLYTVS